jgi:hypothetical protein
MQLPCISTNNVESLQTTRVSIMRKPDFNSLLKKSGIKYMNFPPIPELLSTINCQRHYYEKIRLQFSINKKVKIKYELPTNSRAWRKEPLPMFNVVFF